MRRYITSTQLKETSSFSYYKNLLNLEFEGKTPHEVYELSFSRLLKKDAPRIFFPSVYHGAPFMIGTDERDMFVPLSQNVLNNYKNPVSILDMGAGDGQTLAHLIDYIPEHSTFDAIEPNNHYLGEYKKVIDSHHREYNARDMHKAGFEEIITTNKNNNFYNKYEIIFCFHAIYFSESIVSFLNFILDSLKKGGKSIIVFADESQGFTGTIVQNYLKQYHPKDGNKFIKKINERHEAFNIKEKQKSFMSQSVSTKKIQSYLGRTDLKVMTIKKQKTRLFGHDLGDILAHGFITNLPFCDDRSWNEKIGFVANFLVQHADLIELGIETKGIRKRMISVSEPQIYIELQKI